MRAARKAIVVLTSDHADYSRAIVEAVSAVAGAAGFGTLCVTGRELAPGSASASKQAVCNRVYRLIESTDVAGLICESGLICHRAGPEAVIRFMDRFRLPCVSLGLDVPGTPSVIVDDSEGMRRLMEHLTADSRHQRFAFVRGVPGDIFSLERERIFRDVLGRQGREIDESLFVTGNYDMFDAYEVVTQLLRAHSKIDAIVAANDVMALSAGRAATAAGFSIPRDLVVSGFDDVPDAMRHSPALTTVRQPLVDMAEAAIAKLFRLIDETTSGAGSKGCQARRLSKVSSELIVRGSTQSAVRLASDEHQMDAHGIRRFLDAGMTGLKAPPDVDLNDLAGALEHALKDGCTTLGEHLALVAGQVCNADSHWWSNLCHQIEKLSRQVLDSSDRKARLPIIEAALARLRERIWAVEMEREFSARRLQKMRSTMQLQIGSSTSIEEMLDVIDHWIRAFRAQRIFLVCYDEPSAEPSATGRLIRASRSGVIEVVNEASFSTAGILPEAYAGDLERGTLVLTPVYAGNDHFGYLMIDPQGLDVSQIDSAAHSIGNAMRSHYLVRKLESQAERLQMANEKLSTLANRDALTGLPNRLCFDRKLLSLCQSSDSNDQFALCFLDLDGFKGINDSLGHKTGDLLLKNVADCLERIVAETAGERGFVARLGGDEFTVIIQSPQAGDGLDHLASAMLAALSGQQCLNGQVVRISASIGVSMFPTHGRDTESLLRCADAAMYRAKSLGKNRFTLYSGGDGQVLSTSLASTLQAAHGR